MAVKFVITRKYNIFTITIVLNHEQNDEKFCFVSEMHYICSIIEIKTGNDLSGI